MLDLDKIKLMCQLSVFEEKEGRDVFEINKYYKSDYISKNMASTLLHYTLCFLLIALLLLMLRVNDIFLLISLDFIKTVGTTVLLIFFGGMVVVAFISYIMYAKRYEDSHRLQLFYTAKLNRLLKMETAESGEAATAQETRIDSKKSLYAQPDEAPYEDTDAEESAFYADASEAEMALDDAEAFCDEDANAAEYDGEAAYAAAYESAARQRPVHDVVPPARTRGKSRAKGSRKKGKR